MLKHRAIFLACATAVGLITSFGAGCEPPEPPDMCGPEDLFGDDYPCNPYGEVIIGTPPNCDCVLFEDVEVAYLSTGQVDVTINLPTGWTLNSVTGTINGVALSGQKNNTWVTSQGVSVTGRSRSGNTFTVSLAGADETFLAVSELSALKLRMRSNLTVTATDPQSQQVQFALPFEMQAPVTMTDDCTDRYFDGTLQYSNVTVDVEGTFDSPGC